MTNPQDSAVRAPATSASWLECVPLLDLGWDRQWDVQARHVLTGDTVPARVLRHDGKSILVGGPEGVGRVHLRASTPAVAVGDWVLVDHEAVHELVERRSLLQRRDPSTGFEQLIAANIDVVGIVCGLDRPVRAGRIERFVALALDAGAEPLVVLTKRDLVAECAEAARIVRRSAPGAELACVSAMTGTGIVELRHSLTGRTVAFVGESGAGKSALLNALAGQPMAETGDVRAGDHKGRHTTTARQLHSLGERCSVIDTPGLREIGIWTDTDTVDHVFDEITDRADGCRFRDCSHTVEPGCAVQQAVRDGEIDAERIESWERLRREAASAELRADTHSRHRAERRFGKMVRQAQRDARR